MGGALLCKPPGWCTLRAGRAGEGEEEDLGEREEEAVPSLYVLAGGQGGEGGGGAMGCALLCKLPDWCTLSADRAGGGSNRISRGAPPLPPPPSPTCSPAQRWLTI